MPAATLFHRIIVVGFASALGACSFMSGSAAAELPKITPPTIAGGKQSISLPANADDLVVGGGGRYLALQFSSQQKIAVFDINQLKIVGEVPAEAKAKFAAGATKLLVLEPEKETITRYDLATQKAEATKPIDQAKRVAMLVMGSASEGPAIICTGIGFKAVLSELDLATLVQAPLPKNERGQGSGEFIMPTSARMSADGSVFVQISDSDGWMSHFKKGNSWTAARHADHCGHVAPSPDGSLLYTGAGVFKSSGGNVFETPTYADKWELCVPAVHGPYYLVVAGDPGDSITKSVGLRIGNENKTRDTPANLGPVIEGNDKWAREPLTLEKRLLLIPQAKLILQLSPTHDAFTAISYDPDEALKRSGDPFLYVTSNPPRSVKAGERLTYQVTAVSGSGGLQYKLDAAPVGMQISPTGLVTWAPTPNSPASSQVIVAVRDKSNQAKFQSFSLEVSGGQVGGVAETAPVPAPIANASPAKQLPVTPPADKQDHRVIDLPGKVANVACGGNGRFFIIHFRDQSKLGVFDVSQAKIVGYLPASEGAHFAAGAKYVIVCDAQAKTVNRYRLDTLELEATAPWPFGTEIIKQIVLGAGSEGPALALTSQGTSELAKTQLQFFDVATLKVISTAWPDNRSPTMHFRDFNLVYPAASSPVFSITRFGALRFAANQVDYVGHKFLNKVVGGYPAAGGNFYLFEGRPLDSDQVALTPPNLQQSSWAVPAVSGNYYLSFAAFSLKQQQEVTVSAYGESRALVTVPNLRFDLNIHGSRDMGTYDKRLFFIPEAHSIVTFPATGDQLEMRRVSIDEALAAANFDYIVVESSPPSQAALGKTFTYDIKVKSKRGALKFSFEPPIAGMAISPTGKLTWDVPATFSETTQKVTVTVSDAGGQSQKHAFLVDLPEVRTANALAQGTAEEQRRLAAEAVQRKLLEPRGAQPGASPVQPVREWKDATGMYTIKASFIEIVDKKTVVLKLENGETRKFPLSKLADADIYEAVRLDLQQRQAPPPGPQPPPKIGATPFD